ncbi:MAG: hypothetical protein RIT28_672 [Pseudomonadota bacterium]|jgi:hypothetical protein
MNFRPLMLLAALTAVALPAVDAFAGKEKDKSGEAAESKYPEIKTTAVEDFNPAFLKAKTIHDTLQATENNLTKVNTSLAAALKLDQTTSLDKALAELKTKAGKKLTVSLERGRVPKVSPEDAVVPEVQTAIDTLNTSLDDLDKTLQDVEKLVPEVKGLVAEVAAFPGMINPDIFKRNGVAAADIPKVTKQINSNIKAINATPERLAAVTDLSLATFGQVKAAFQ